jgi:hypothetical protein
MEISIAELRKISDLLFEHLEQTGRSTISVPVDYYWFVPEKALYDFDSAPKELTVGQLSDDMNELRMIAAHENEPFAFAFVWLSAVLRFVGETIVS